jgi:hypothetical protein
VPGLDGDAQLGAHAVSGGHEDRVAVAGGAKVEEGAEAAEPRHVPGRSVALASGLIRSTSALPASMSTPDCA